MNKEFDYVAFAKNFEATNGRPPTADELDNAKWEHFGIRWQEGLKLQFVMKLQS